MTACANCRAVLIKTQEPAMDGDGEQTITIGVGVGDNEGFESFIDIGDGLPADCILAESDRDPTNELNPTILASEAIKFIFEDRLRLNKKSISSNTIIKMCHDCISALAGLYKFYMKFQKLSAEASYISQLLEVTLDKRNDVQHVQPTEVLTIKLEVDDTIGQGSKYINNSEMDDRLVLIEQEQPEDDDDSDFEIKRPNTRYSKRVLRPVRKSARNLKKSVKESATIKTPRTNIKRSTRKRKLGNESSESLEPKSPVIPIVPKGSDSISPNQKALYSCTEQGCKKSWNSGKLFRRHLKFFHGVGLENPKELEARTCSICSKVFGLPSKLKCHMNNVHSSEKPFECTDCDPPKKFPTKEYLSIHRITRHVRKKEPKEIELLPCHNCDEKFKTKLNLAAHLKLVHNEIQRYACSICPKIFKSSKLYRYHIKYRHGDGLTAEDCEGKVCNICSKVFPTPSQLKLHQTNTHTAEESVTCPLCSKIFSSRFLLTAHNRAHSDDPTTYDCLLCEKSYKSKKSLKEHISSAHMKVKDFVCEICGHKTNSSTSLKRHVVIHDGNRTRSFQCPTCLECFYTQKILQVHLKIHDPEAKDRICQFCGERFMRQNCLKRHLQTKHAEIPEVARSIKMHRCDICGKEFKLKEYLKQHMRSKTHGGKGHAKNLIKKVDIDKADIAGDISDPDDDFPKSLNLTTTTVVAVPSDLEPTTITLVEPGTVIPVTMEGVGGSTTSVPIVIHTNYTEYRAAGSATHTYAAPSQWFQYQFPPQ